MKLFFDLCELGFEVINGGEIMANVHALGG
jgi:hypothetical protein